MKKQILFFIIFISLISCSENKEIRYYDTGTIMSECPTHKGKKSGLCTTYTELGKVSSLISFYDDVEWGLAIQYFENENIKSISSWDYGILENQYISFFSDGSIEEKAYFKDGKQYCPIKLQNKFYKI